MKESTWRRCKDLKRLLRHLRDKAAPRRLLLFAAACCRQRWSVLVDARSREAVEAAERFADGLLSEEELDRAADQAHSVIGELLAARPSDPSLLSPRYRATYRADAAWRVAAAPRCFDNLTLAVDRIAGDAEPGCEAKNRDAQIRLLRDLFGPLPFRPVSLDPAWRTPAVLALAQAAYDNRILPAGHLDAERLAVLADALQEAGCDNTELLAHLREPGPHVRGCFSVDAVLGRT